MSYTIERQEGRLILNAIGMSQRMEKDTEWFAKKE